MKKLALYLCTNHSKLYECFSLLSFIVLLNTIFRMVVLAKLNEIVKEWIKQLSLEKVCVC